MRNSRGEYWVDDSCSATTVRPSSSAMTVTIVPAIPISNARASSEVPWKASGECGPILTSDSRDPAARAAGENLVGELAGLQQAAPRAGYSPGYLSAFPEEYFGWLEAGQSSRVWSPYYMIHKNLAGLINQYALAGSGQALDVATRLADWVDRRTAPFVDLWLHSGDLLVFGGETRRIYHGVPKVLPATAPAGLGLPPGRLSITIRETGLS